MSYVQYLEELEYDTQSEYINVLRQEAYDPYEFEDHCEEHDTVFLRNEGCEQCPVREPHNIDWGFTPSDDDPPF